MTENERTSMLEHFESVRISRLSAGDVITLPNGRKITIATSMVHKDRQQLTMPQNPIPYNIVRTDGQWRVDVAPIIAGRLAAEAARNRLKK